MKVFLFNFKNISPLPSREGEDQRGPMGDPPPDVCVEFFNIFIQLDAPSPWGIYFQESNG